MRRLVFGLLALGALAACSGGTYGTAPSGSSATTVKVASSSLGSILTDAKGAPLYYYTADTESHSTCSGQCAINWLPLLQPNFGLLQAPSGSPTGAGLSGTLATTARSDGGRQVTYNDRPLYTFSGDKKPGDLAGQGIDGVWFVATPSLTDPHAGAQVAPTTLRPPAPTAAPAGPAPVAAPAAPVPPAPRAAPTPAAAPGFNDHDADNAGGRSDGDGNG